MSFFVGQTQYRLSDGKHTPLVMRVCFYYPVNPNSKSLISAASIDTPQCVDSSVDVLSLLYIMRCLGINISALKTFADRSM